MIFMDLVGFLRFSSVLVNSIGFLQCSLILLDISGIARFRTQGLPPHPIVATLHFVFIFYTGDRETGDSDSKKNKK